MHRIRVVMIGGLNSPVPGGTVISFRQLVESLQHVPQLEMEVINSAGIRGQGIRGLIAFASLIVRIAKKSLRADVVALHGSTTGLHILAPVVTLCAKVAKKPVIIRKFGGSDYVNYSLPRRMLIQWSICQVYIYLVQTRILLEAAQARGIKNVRLYPNSREMPQLPDGAGYEGRSCRRFVYVGHVREYKGIRELVEAAERLDSSTTVDVYGPRFDDLPPDIFDHHRRISYKGVLDHRDAVSTMQQYDALVLPTKAPSEGHPGVILEAYIAGLPVIATTCGAIPEIVDETTGILVEPHDANGLFEAMQTMVDNDDLYKRLCNGVRKKRSHFSIEASTKRFVEFVEEAAFSSACP